MDITKQRLTNQLLTTHPFENPWDVISWFGAIQAQDFAAVKWAIALRTPNQTDASIENAFNEGKILRTHLMRPTWHFVTPQDIRWILALTSPRVQKFNGYYYRKSGFEKTIFQKSNSVIQKTLQGGKQLTRDELKIKLEEANIPTKELGLTYCVMQAELDGIICSGPRRGKQFTYMLLEERVSTQPKISPDEALEELTKRFFQSHGPALVKDFSWWSGITIADAKRGIELAKLGKMEHNGNTYWFCSTKKTLKQTNDEVYLIPGFDEYFIAYAERRDILDSTYKKHLNQGGGMVNGAIVANGKMVGGWKRRFKGKNADLTIQLFETINEIQKRAIEQQAERFGKFLNMPVVTTVID